MMCQLTSLIHWLVHARSPMAERPGGACLARIPGTERPTLRTPPTATLPPHGSVAVRLCRIGPPLGVGNRPDARLRTGGGSPVGEEPAVPPSAAHGESGPDRAPHVHARRPRPRRRPHPRGPQGHRGSRSLPRGGRAQPADRPAHPPTARGPRRDLREGARRPALGRGDLLHLSPALRLSRAGDTLC